MTAHIEYRRLSTWLMRDASARLRRPPWEPSTHRTCAEPTRSSRAARPRARSSFPASESFHRPQASGAAPLMAFKIRVVSEAIKSTSSFRTRRACMVLMRIGPSRRNDS